MVRALQWVVCLTSSSLDPQPWGQCHISGPLMFGCQWCAEGWHYKRILPQFIVLSCISALEASITDERLCSPRNSEHVLLVVCVALVNLHPRVFVSGIWVAKLQCHCNLGNSTDSYGMVINEEGKASMNHTDDGSGQAIVQNTFFSWKFEGNFYEFMCICMLLHVSSKIHICNNYVMWLNIKSSIVYCTSLNKNWHCNTRILAIDCN